MSEKALISVIIPVYNVENYLSRCLDSVLNQTYKNLEIILVDDGSTDSSSLICDEYAEKDGRVKVIHKANEGAAMARNTGLDTATGEYISFVDSDDLINKEMIEKLYAGITENNCDIAVCGYWLYFENKEIDYEKTSRNITEKIFLNNETIDVFGWSDYVASNSVWSKLVKAELFDGVSFPKFRTAEDLYVTFKLFHKAKKVYATDDKMYYYICRQGSLMHGKELNTEDTINVCDLLTEYCRDEIEDNTEKECAIKKIVYIENNTILDNYYLAIKRDLDKEEREYHKKLYIDAKQKYKGYVPESLKYKLFEKSPWLFYLSMSIFTKMCRNEIV